MLRKAFWLIALGLFAFWLEFGLGIRTLPLYPLVFVAVFLFLILATVSKLSPKTSGRLKGAKSTDAPDTDESRPLDGVFELSAVIYVGVYAFILLDVRPRPYDRIRDIFFTLSPVEMYLLVAPLVVLFWIRYGTSKDKQDKR